MDWWPWGEEALALARAEQKPIFLSIGYSACHWCHVMAHESFENPEIARLLNEHFVSIKVDREERPDLDQIYMEAVQMMTGRGGWPMSVFLTPECEPFFGGTYWPPRRPRRHGRLRPGAAAVADAWQRPPRRMVEQADEITQLLRERIARGRKRHPIAGTAAGAARLTGTWPQMPRHALRSRPKRRCGRRSTRSTAASGRRRSSRSRWPCAGCCGAGGGTGDDELLQMVTATLDRMAAGGIFDHLGGGFHRYSVDARWLSPHFEKMLYDNALLAACYLEAWQATGEAGYAAVVAADARLSAPRHDRSAGRLLQRRGRRQRRRGRQVLLWTPGEIEAVLGAEAARTFCRVYDVTEEGNFEGRNILNLSRPLDGRGEDARPSSRPQIGQPSMWRPPARIAWRRGRSARPARAATKRCWSAGTVWPSTPWPARARARRTSLHGGGQRGGRFPLDPSPPRRRAAAALLARRPGEARRLSRRLCRPGKRPADAPRNAAARRRGSIRRSPGRYNPGAIRRSRSTAGSSIRPRTTSR